VTGKLVLYLEEFLRHSSANRMIQSCSTHMNTPYHCYMTHALKYLKKSLLHVSFFLYE